MQSATPESGGRDRIDTLQAGRGLASFAVVLHHANLASKDFGNSHVPLFEYGWLGVDFFFVLSGFIIAYSVGDKGAKTYAWHRFRRVLIPYWPIGIALGLLYMILPSASAGDREWTWLASLTLLPIGSPALSVAWTLQHELIFYAIFGIAWFTRQYWVFFVWAGLCLLGSEATPLKAINLEFLMGILAFLVVRSGKTSPLFLLPAAIALAAWIYLGASREQSVLLGVAIGLALPGLIALEQRGMSIPTSLVSLGEASYSLYLAHGIAISIVARLYPSLPILVIAGVAGGLAYYFAVERPLLSIIPRNPPKLLFRRARRQSS